MMHSTKISQMVPLHWRRAARALDEKCLQTKSTPEPLLDYLVKIKKKYILFF